MGNWKSLLKADPTGWLLEEDNPSVRYLTLVDILGKPAGGAEARKARAAIMARGAAPLILDKQEEGGHWDQPDRMYAAKYRGTLWQLVILAEHLADGGDHRIRKACEFVLEHSQDRQSGGFSMHRAARAGGGRHSEVIPCLTGNMAWSLIRLGYMEDPRVQLGIDWITTYQRFDDGIAAPPTGWPYDKYEMCFGRHTCHMGAVKALKALSEIPPGERSAEVRRTIDAGVEHILRHHVYRQSHNLARASKPGWLRFGFPLMYQTDVLEILGILTALGYRDKRMQEAMDAVVARQDGRGRWKLADTFNGRFQVDIETRGQPSKWITLRALKVLKAYYG